MNKALFLLLLLFLPLVAYANPSKTAAEEPLTFYLDKETTTLHGHYTIEYYFSPGVSTTRLASAKVLPKSFAKITQLADYLAGQLQDAQILVDHANPNVIHIIDKALSQQKDYGLNKVTDIVYSGSLSGIPKAIATATHQNITFLDSNNVALMYAHPDPTQVKVNMKKSPCREIVTSAALLPGCSRQLWVASTSATDNSNTTSIYFPPAGS